MTGQSKLLQLGVPRRRTRHRCLQQIEGDGLKIDPVAVFRGTLIALSGESEAVPEASKPETKTHSFASTYTRAGVGSSKPYPARLHFRPQATAYVCLNL